MKRSDVLAHARFAGYHSDARALVRLKAENRIDNVAVNRAYDEGFRARQAGVKCTCADCKVPA